MSENYLMLNGKRIELTDEQAKMLTGEENKSPFARAKMYDRYFYIDRYGVLDEDSEDGWWIDDECYSVANYCTDKTMMQQRALHETLNRLLWRYSEKHGGDCKWDCSKHHWHIVKNETNKTFITEFSDVIKRQGVIYFKDKETAQAAINEIVKPFMKEHPEFVW